MARKRSFRGKPKKSKSDRANPGDLMNQFQQMQADMARAQEDLAAEVMTVTAGGGAIAVDITGHQRVVGLRIDPEIVDPDDIEMLQDLLMAAFNAALEQSQAKSAERMEGLTGNLGIDDLLGGLGGM